MLRKFLKALLSSAKDIWPECANAGYIYPGSWCWAELNQFFLDRCKLIWVADFWFLEFGLWCYNGLIAPFKKDFVIIEEEFIPIDDLEPSLDCGLFGKVLPILTERSSLAVPTLPWPYLLANKLICWPLSRAGPSFEFSYLHDIRIRLNSIYIAL